jgi:hypothetical protein
MENRIAQHLDTKDVYGDLISVPESPIVQVTSFENEITDGSVMLAIEALEVAAAHLEELREYMVMLGVDSIPSEVLEEVAYVSDGILTRSDSEEV